MTDRPIGLTRLDRGMYAFAVLGHDDITRHYEVRKDVDGHNSSSYVWVISMRVDLGEQGEHLIEVGSTTNLDDIRNWDWRAKPYLYHSEEQWGDRVGSYIVKILEAKSRQALSDPDSIPQDIPPEPEPREKEPGMPLEPHPDVLTDLEEFKILMEENPERAQHQLELANNLLQLLQVGISQFIAAMDTDEALANTGYQLQNTQSAADLDGFEITGAMLGVQASRGSLLFREIAAFVTAYNEVLMHHHVAHCENCQHNPDDLLANDEDDEG